MQAIADDQAAQSIVSFINNELNPCQTITTQTNLISSGFLDSASFKALAVFLEETFAIELAGCDMTEEWFCSAEKLALLIAKKQSQEASLCG